MNVLTVTDTSIDSIARQVGDILAGCGICILPTDTIYGIVALERCSGAVQRIYEIKKRPAQKQFIRLISGLQKLQQYTDQEIPADLLRFWPGPLTLIVQRRGGKTVALRYPDDQFLNALFECIDGESIVAPSANISGEENIFDCRRLVEVFGGLVDCIVCDARMGVDPSVEPVASTIVDISGLHPRIIREGALRVML